MTNRRGTILITTLWILAILSVLAVGIGFRVSLEARLSKYNIDKLRAAYLAKAGIYKARNILLSYPNRSIDTIRECGIALPTILSSPGEDTLLENIFGFDKNNLGEGRFEVSYDEEGRHYYGMMDEDRKININKANQFVLANLIISADRDVLAASIVNWRGTVQMTRGAWDDDYQSLAMPYKCKHAEFSTIEELMLVKGITPEIFESIKDYITVYGDGKININTATRRVMLACGLGDALIISIMNVRNGADRIAGTKDDGLVNEISPEATGKWDITSEERNALNNFTTRSNYFRIDSKGAVNKSKIDTRIVCIIDKGSKKLRYYREY